MNNNFMHSFSILMKVSKVWALIKRTVPKITDVDALEEKIILKMLTMVEMVALFLRQIVRLHLIWTKICSLTKVLMATI